MSETTTPTTPDPLTPAEGTPAAVTPPAPVEGAAPKADAAAAGTSLIGSPTPKEGTEPKPAEKPVEDIQLKLPDGVKVDEKFLGDFKGIAKELQLKSEGAQKLVDLHLNFVNNLAKEFADAGTKRAADWMKAVESDPDLGGSKIKDTSLTVHMAVQKFGGDEFRKSVDEMGLGNWPPLVKFLHRVGATLKDDTAAIGATPAATPTNDDEAFHRSLYDKSPGMFSAK